MNDRVGSDQQLARSRQQHHAIGQGGPLFQANGASQRLALQRRKAEASCYIPRQDETHQAVTQTALAVIKNNIASAVIRLHAMDSPSRTPGAPRIEAGNLALHADGRLALFATHSAVSAYSAVKASFTPASSCAT